MDRANIVIVGGGVVGCAVARAVSRLWSDVFLIEQMPKLGMGASTRNSGVIHSGIYYPPGSLKGELCVAGNRMLYEFCAEHNVPHRNCGSWWWRMAARRKSSSNVWPSMDERTALQGCVSWIAAPCARGSRTSKRRPRSKCHPPESSLPKTS